MKGTYLCYCRSSCPEVFLRKGVLNCCIFSEHLFLRTPLDGCFCYCLICTISLNFANKNMWISDFQLVGYCPLPYRKNFKRLKTFEILVNLQSSSLPGCHVFMVNKKCKYCDLKNIVISVKLKTLKFSWIWRFTWW